MSINPQTYRFTPGTKSEGRERVRQACHRCRLKKLRCDGVVPCGRCISAGNICQHRERKKISTEETHIEYVANLEEQQHLLATALKLTWSHLYPEECAEVPSIHEMVARLRMLPAHARITIPPAPLTELPSADEDQMEALRTAHLPDITAQLDQAHQQMMLSPAHRPSLTTTGTTSTDSPFTSASTPSSPSTDASSSSGPLTIDPAASSARGDQMNGHADMMALSAVELPHSWSYMMQDGVVEPWQLDKTLYDAL